MEETKKITVDGKLIAEVVITGIGVAASIGAAGVTGAILGSCNLSKVSGVAKVFMPLGVAGMSAAGGYMAGDAMRRVGQETWTGIDTMSKILKAYGSAATTEETKEEAQVTE